VPLLLSTAGFTLLYIAVPNCRVPFKHCIIGGFVAALAFHAARALFTKVMVGSSYAFIYGAFAAVPLFLLWIYLSWNIVLMGGILVHSFSAYQTAEQARRPTVLKALDVLYLFWQKQQAGQSVREIELLNNSHPVVRGLDSETWRELRDLFIKERIIAQDDKGHYLLRRDLNSIEFWQLKEWVNDERPLDKEDISARMDWQENAYNLLRRQRTGQRELLETSLVELYSA
jgi:membrane protein